LRNHRAYKSPLAPFRSKGVNQLKEKEPRFDGICESLELKNKDLLYKRRGLSWEERESVAPKLLKLFPFSDMSRGEGGLANKGKASGPIVATIFLRLRTTRVWQTFTKGRENRKSHPSWGAHVTR